MADNGRTDPDIRRKALAKYPTDDLSWIIGAYCGPHNELLSMKVFGWVISKEDVEQETIERLLLSFESPSNLIE